MNQQDKLLIDSFGSHIQILASGQAINRSLTVRGASTTIYAAANPDGKIESCYWATSSASPHDVAIADGQCFIDRFYEQECSPFHQLDGSQRYSLFVPDRAKEAAAYYKVRMERRKQILAKLYADETEE